MGRNQAQTGASRRMIGKVIAGRYSLVRMLGDGGMGAVYKAEDNVLRRFVALKLLHPAAAANPATVARFLREAQSAASIGHPNIIDILDYGEAEGKPYLVMEYLRGRSLAEAIQSDGAHPIRDACAVATHALAGLQAAHDRGILHRDLKPANLMLVVRFGDKAFVKLLDFGFATLFGGVTAPDKTLTPARTLVGTPAYAAPERLRGDERRDPRTDLYSLGVVLYETLAGVRPYDAPTFAELARKVQSEPVPPLSRHRSDLPRELDRVVMKALAKKPDERWQDAASFASALVPFGGHRLLDESENDSLTMDLIRIRARDKKRDPTTVQTHPPQVSPARAEPGPQPPAGAAGDAPQGTARASERAHRARTSVPPPGADRPASKHPSAQPVRAHPAPEPLAASMRSSPAPLVKRPEESPASTRTGTGRRQPLPSVLSDTLRTQPSLVAALEEPVDDTTMGGGLSKRKDRPSQNDRIQRPAEVPLARPPTTPRKAPGEESPAFEGRVILAILRFVSRRYGERALKTVLDALPEHARGVFQAGVSPGAWMPFDAVTKLVETIDAALGRGDLHLVADCGRAVAEGTFDEMKRLGPPTPPPELLLAEMPTFLDSLVRGIECKVRSVGRGYGRLELDEFKREPSLTTCVLILGFLDRSLGRFGAREVEVNLLTSRYLGDEENLFDISWLIL